MAKVFSHRCRVPVGRSPGLPPDSHQLAAITDKLVRMSTADTHKDPLAAVVEEQWIDFQDRLSDPGKRYPTQEFEAQLPAVTVPPHGLPQLGG